MKHKFEVGQIVTTSRCSFLQNRMRESSTVTALLPRSADGFFYLTQDDYAAPEQVKQEDDLAAAASWELS
jgi:hypothetical protein